MYTEIEIMLILLFPYSSLFISLFYITRIALRILEVQNMYNISVMIIIHVYKFHSQLIHESNNEHSNKTRQIIVLYINSPTVLPTQRKPRSHRFHPQFRFANQISWSKSHYGKEMTTHRNLGCKNSTVTIHKKW